MKFTCAIMLALVLFATGCKKKTIPPVVPPVAFTTDQYFFPLKIGNYWAYQKVDTGQNRTYVDTIRIVSDTIINSITYYSIMGGVSEGVTDGYYGDSAGNIIGWPSGYPFALSNKTNDTLGYFVLPGDTSIERTGNIDTLMNVTAGVFNNSIQVITDEYYTGGFPRPGENYLYFSKGVGVTYGKIFYQFQPTNILTMQLVGYHISP
jgi:hypothetical protein